jgi:hypothetical protein
MIYFILDLSGGNYVNTYGSENETLADVRDMASRFGRGEVTSWALARREDDKSVTATAQGDELIDHAEAAGANV